MSFNNQLDGKLNFNLVAHLQGSVSPLVALLTFSVVFGSGVASTALWYYSRRYVGELALLGKKHDSLQLSVMDFWGNREVC